MKKALIVFLTILSVAGSGIAEEKLSLDKKEVTGERVKAVTNGSTIFIEPPLEFLKTPIKIALETVFLKAGRIPYSFDVSMENYGRTSLVSNNKIELERMLAWILKPKNLSYKKDDKGVYHINKSYESSEERTTRGFRFSCGINAVAMQGIKRLLTKYGSAYLDTDINTVIVTDKLSVLENIEQLLKIIDVPTGKNITKLFVLVHVNPYQVIEQVKKLLTKDGVVSTTNDKRILVTDDPKVFREIDRLLYELDKSKNAIFVEPPLEINNVSITAALEIILKASKVPYSIGDIKVDLSPAGNITENLTKKMELEELLYSFINSKGLSFLKFEIDDNGVYRLSMPDGIHKDFRKFTGLFIIKNTNSYKIKESIEKLLTDDGIVSIVDDKSVLITDKKHEFFQIVEIWDELDKK